MSPVERDLLKYSSNPAAARRTVDTRERLGALGSEPAPALYGDACREDGCYRTTL